MKATPTKIPGRLTIGTRWSSVTNGVSSSRASTKKPLTKPPATNCFSKKTTTPNPSKASWRGCTDLAATEVTATGFAWCRAKSSMLLSISVKTPRPMASGWAKCCQPITRRNLGIPPGFAHGFLTLSDGGVSTRPPTPGRRSTSGLLSGTTKRSISIGR